MKKLIKPASLLFYFQTILIFFLVGVTYSGLTNAAKGQGLAGGAIVVGYGVMFAFIAFITSIIVAYYVRDRIIVITNRIMAILLVIAIGILTYRFMNREQNKKPTKEYPKKTSAPAVMESNLFFSRVFQHPQEVKNTPLGLGFFKPNFYKDTVLYFYGNPNWEKSVQEHAPTDSITFEKTEYGSFDISYAPPWLVPDHLKMDYDILYFRIQSISRDFVEITVNNIDQRSIYVNRFDGDIIYWPEFLLSVNSVEFIDGKEQIIRIKPLNYAGEVNTNFIFMQPLIIKGDWMMVRLVDDDYKTVGKGWIQWKKGDSLIIKYSLFS